MADILNKQSEDPVSDKPSNRTVAEILKAHNDLLKDPKFQQEAPPETKKEVEDSRQKAYDLYQQRATRAEWQEVAQTIGDALGRFAAATQGLNSGQDMSKLNTGPGIDYQKRIDRYGKDYERQAGAAEANATAARQTWADKEAMRRQGLEEAVKPLSEELKVAGQREKDAADTAQQGQREKSALDRVLAEVHSRSEENTKKQQFEASENAKDRQLKRELANTGRKDEYSREERDSKREQERIDNTELKSLQQTLKEAEKRQQAAAGLYSDMIRSGNLNKKSREKMEASFGKRAGEAGFDLGKAQEFEESSSKPSSFLGIPLGKTRDDAAYKEKLKGELIDKQANEVARLKQEIADRMEKRKQALPGGVARSTSVSSSTKESGGQSVQVPASQAVTPQPSGKVRVQFKGKTLEIPADKLQDALRDGAVQVK